MTITEGWLEYEEQHSVKYTAIPSEETPSFGQEPK
jgi:hypothetical protein